MKPRLQTFLATGLVIVAIFRIASTYRHTSQLFDEPCHAAAAIELLDRHTYKLDPVHPPLARIAIGIPLYLAGERYPQMSPEEAATANYNVVGDHILYDSGHYMRNLMLARSAMLPFFIALCVFVFLWTRREFGANAALGALFLVTTTPIILALASVAYTHLVTATTQFAAIFAFTCWLERPTRRSTLLLGLAIGLALMSKLTSLVYLPSALLAIASIRWIQLRKAATPDAGVKWKKLFGAVAIGIVLLWGSYGFTFGHVRDEFNLSVSSMPSFQHFPGPLRNLARSAVLNDWRIPAPALFHGFAEAWVLNKTVAPAYMFGNLRERCWYFFLSGVFFKTPIPLIILCVIGLCAAIGHRPDINWKALAPAIAVLAIFLVTLPMKYHAGMRHVLVLFPLLSVVGGAGIAYLLSARASWQRCMTPVLVLLLAWQGFETVRAQKDFVAYFNEFAGRDPSRIMLTGCDLDCGQDIFRLADALRAKGVSHFDLAVWSSAEMDRMGLPAFDVLQPSEPVTGWIAISARSQRLGHVLHDNYGPTAYTWLQKYQPVARVGQTILLYHIPSISASN